MEDIAELLAQSMALHGGHPCPGQVLGVRMAMAGCRELGIQEPKKTKQLVVYVEIDRCATDAIQAVTNCKLGKRTLKHMDYGKMAATFVNLATGKAVRVVALESAREKAQHYCQPGAAGHEAQIQAYKIMPEEEILTLIPVSVSIPPQDLPGPPSRRVTCEACGECVNDGREILRDGRVLCRSCARGAYYTQVLT
ncbi:MAG: FmdE family protein [Dehalococcoidia bacterium]|nr:FmdE family protein [Dehalococcoidia bacterium]